MNVLVLDPKTVVVEASEVYQQEQLDGFGFEVIPVPFRDAYPFGGGLHCATGDVFRRAIARTIFRSRFRGPGSGRFGPDLAPATARMRPDSEKARRMKIESIETYSTRYVCMVRVRSDSGEEGWGQAAPYHADITARCCIARPHLTPSEPTPSTSTR